MKSRFLSLLGLCFLASLLAGDLHAAGDLQKGFLKPPASARLWVYWFWLNGGITRQTITSDLEAMARVGIGGVLIMEVNQGTPAGPIPFNSPAWREMFSFAVTEARRLGLEINMNNDAGWAGTGGPWIKPDQGMQQVTFSETPADGGRLFEGVLPQPTTVLNYYRDVAVIAFPTPAEDDNRGNGARITTSSPVGFDAQKLLTSQWPNFVLKGQARLLRRGYAMPLPSPEKPQWIQAEFARPFTARTISFGMDYRGVRNGPVGELQVSDDGITFRTLRQFRGQPPEITLNIPETSARFFRVVFNNMIMGVAGDKYRGDFLPITHFHVSPAWRMENLAGKAVMLPSQFHIGTAGAPPTSASYPTLPGGLAIPRDRVIDLTAKMDARGKLTWKVPEGRWTILRVGRTSTGERTVHAPASGTGLESDKLSKEATRAAYDGFIGKLAAENRKFTGIDRTFVSTHVDSWEVLSQNWTPLMQQEFKRLRGYDLLQYLPVLTGRIVESPEVSERFLWDFRRTVADLVVENYAAEMRRLAGKDHLRFSMEGYDGAPADEIRLGGQSGEPMCEFWLYGADTSWSVSEMASAAHIYGRPVVGAEAFTSSEQEKWRGHPAAFKELGDWAFAEGVNRLVVSLYAMQPWKNERFPGMSMGPWGVHYERTQTWWEYSRPWHDYVARCQFLLRQGLPVSDLCVVNPENATRYRIPQSVSPAQTPEISRPGYNFDVCPPDALISLMQADKGRAVLANGTSYRAIVLPDVPTMTPQFLRKVRQLAGAGVPVFGSGAPVKSPSLEGFPQCDDEVKKLAGELWTGGKVITDKTPAQYFADEGVPPDFASRTGSGKSLRFTHRVTGTTDIYFIASGQPQSESALCYFRSSGRRPELWRPETGRFEQAAVYDEVNGRIVVPVQFEPDGSVFVVFRDGHPVEPNRVISVDREGKPVIASDKVVTLKESGLTQQIALRRQAKGAVELEAFDPGVYQLKLANGKTRDVRIEVTRPLPLDGPWQVTFDPKWGGPEQAVTFDTLTDWSKNESPGIRYYSGSATYRKTFQVDDPALLKNTILDLGRVAVMAEVKLNGQDLGILWKPPFRINITSALKSGGNAIEIKIINLWVNRMIGDEQLPEDSERDFSGPIGASLKSYPKWLLDGQPSPAGRFTFTAWRTLGKDDALMESGLLGPVTLLPVQETVVKPGR